MNISNFFPTPAPASVTPAAVFTPLSQTNFLPVSGSAVVPFADLSTLLFNTKQQLSQGTGILSNKTTIVELAPGNIQALSPSLYFTLLNQILFDTASRYNLVIDPTKLTYKMIQGHDTSLPVPSVGIEISTTTTSDRFRFRVYFLFGQQTALRFVNRLQEQNYSSTDPDKSTIYLFEGTVSKSDFSDDYAVTFSQTFQNNIPSDKSALLTETGTPLMFLSEENIPLVLEF